MSASATLSPEVASGDHAALAAACEEGVALCTIVGIEGSFSRRIGAQLAVFPDGRTVGSLADRCLDAQLASDALDLRDVAIRRYGRGSDLIDFRLPCGGGLDILLDPSPDRDSCRAALRRLGNRQPAALKMPDASPLRHRDYVPALKICAFGEGPELAMFERLSRAMGLETDTMTKSDLALGRPTKMAPADAWTAIVLLFHDHEWELALIEEALASDAFYIGAQGGETARVNRTVELLSRGTDEGALKRLHSPVGLIPACKTPETLALSVLAEVVGHYEHRRDAR